MSDANATVRELIEEARRYADEQDMHIISFDLDPGEVGDHILLVVAVGLDARNHIARLLNTFMEYEGEGDKE